jgi:hypothetical protein
VVVVDNGRVTVDELAAGYGIQIMAELAAGMRFKDARPGLCVGMRFPLDGRIFQNPRARAFVSRGA